MAKFNPEIKDEAGQQYGGNSRQIAPVEDNLLATLTKGAESIFGTVAQAGYGIMNSKIKNEAQARVDYIRATQGVDTYTEAFPGVPGSAPMTPEQIRQQAGIGPTNIDPTRSDNPPISTVPGEVTPGTPLAAGLPGPDLNPFRIDLARIHAARKAGKLSDTYYTTALEVATRQMRARYPGFRDEIDAAIKQETGITPANALRNAIEADLAAAEKKQLTEVEKRQTYVRSHSHVLTPDEWRTKTLVEQEEIIQQRLYEQAGTDRRRKQLDLEKDEQSAKQSKAHGVMIDEFNTRLSNITGKTREMFASVVARTQGGKPLAPDEMNIIRQQWGQLKAAYQQEIDKIADDPGPDGGKSFSSLIQDPAKVKTAKEQAMAKLAAMEDLLFNEKYGALYHYANALSVSKDATDLGIRADPFIATLDSVKRMFGDVGLNTLFRPDAKDSEGRSVFPRFIDTITKQILGQGAVSVNSGTSFKPISQTITETIIKGPDGKADPKKIAEVIQSTINEYNRIVNDPTSDPKLVAALSTFMNDPKNTDLISQMQSPTDRAKLFSTMVNPQVAASLKKNPASHEEYKQFAISSFTRLFSRDGNELKAAQVGDEYVYFDFNPATGQIQAYPTNAGIKYYEALLKSRGNPADSNLTPEILMNGYVNSKYGQLVSSMNSNLKLMEPIAREYGVDLNTLLKGYVQRFVPPTKPNDNSLFSVLRRKFMGAQGVIDEEAVKPYRHTPLNPTGDPSKTRSILGSTKQISEGEIDQIVRTVYGEAANEPEEGQKAVAAVIMNRMKLTGGDAYDVTLARNQFEPWNNSSTRSVMQRLDKDSDRYKAIKKAVEAAIKGEDPTGGATHFYAPVAQAGLGRLPPSWSAGLPYQDIARHRFYKRQGDFKGDKIPTDQELLDVPSKPLADLPTVEQGKKYREELKSFQDESNIKKLIDEEIEGMKEFHRNTKGARIDNFSKYEDTPFYMDKKPNGEFEDSREFDPELHKRTTKKVQEFLKKLEKFDEEALDLWDNESDPASSARNRVKQMYEYFWRQTQKVS